MGYTCYNEIPKKMEEMQAFKGSSAKGVWEGSLYKVYTYAVPVFCMHRDGTIVYFDNTSYSPTSSRLQNIIGWSMMGKSNQSVPKETWKRDGYFFYRTRSNYDQGITDFLATKDEVNERRPLVETDWLGSGNGIKAGKPLATDASPNENLKSIKESLLQVAGE